MHKLYVHRKQGIKEGFGAEGFRDVWVLMCLWLVGGKGAGEANVRSRRSRQASAAHRKRFPTSSGANRLPNTQVITWKMQFRRDCSVALKRGIF